jgi:hypothetical protein
MNSTFKPGRRTAAFRGSRPHPHHDIAEQQIDDTVMRFAQDSPREHR